MNIDPKNPETLLTVPNEIEAAIIIGALAEYGIESVAVGAYTSAFRAESGYTGVGVTVRHADIESAKLALEEIKEGQTEIDWSTVDVGDTQNEESDS